VSHLVLLHIVVVLPEVTVQHLHNVRPLRSLGCAGQCSNTLDWFLPLAVVSVTHFTFATHRNARFGTDGQDTGGEPASAPAPPRPPASERLPPSPLQKMGASALTSSLCDFIFADESDPDRIEFERKAAAGLRRNFLRGHTVEGSSVAVSEVVGLVLSEWGPEGGPHPDLDSLPLGLRDAVAAWVASHR